MAKTTELTKEEIMHISQLANLSLSDAEVEKYQKVLSETVAYVENLQELDTTKVETTAQSISKPNTYFKDGEKNTRLLTPEEATQNSKQKKGKYFVVNRIM